MTLKLILAAMCVCGVNTLMAETAPAKTEADKPAQEAPKSTENKTTAQADETTKETKEDKTPCGPCSKK